MAFKTTGRQNGKLCPEILNILNCLILIVLKRSVRHALKDAGRNKDKQFELYINLSNVFHFYQSAVFFNVKERDKAKTDIENYLREVHLLHFQT